MLIAPPALQRPSQRRRHVSLRVLEDLTLETGVKLTEGLVGRPQESLRQAAREDGPLLQTDLVELVKHASDMADLASALQY